MKIWSERERARGKEREMKSKKVGTAVDARRFYLLFVAAVHDLTVQKEQELLTALAREHLVHSTPSKKQLN